MKESVSLSHIPFELSSELMDLMAELLGTNAIPCPPRPPCPAAKTLSSWIHPSE